MKKYYVCYESCDPSIIGWAYTQCSDFVNGISEDKKNLIYSIDNYNDTCNYEEIIKIKHLDGIKISGHAKKTDILSYITVR